MMSMGQPQNHSLRVFALLDFYLPGFRAGGPLRTIAGMVTALRQRVAFLVVTRDRDLGTDTPYSTVKLNTWTEGGEDGASIFYMSPGPQRFVVLFRLLRQMTADVLYLNSACSLIFTNVPLLLQRVGLVSRCPTVIAPRGEFAPAALQTKSLRKRIVFAVSQRCGFYRDVIWQASTEYERTDILHVLGQTWNRRVLVAPDFPSFTVADGSVHVAKRAGVLRTVFASRIVPSKNLYGALQILQNVTGPVQFDIYGPAQDHAYWTLCQSMIDQMPANVTVQYHGSVSHDTILDAFRHSDLLLSPTEGENFGHVILEALSVGTPVLISDQTAWRGLADCGAGWDLPLADLKAFRDVIESYIPMDESSYAPLRHAAVAYAQQVTCDPEVTERTMRVFEAALQLSGRVA